MMNVTNPFVLSGRIPRELFCDREEETRRLIQLLTNGHNVLLISQRRMGKTGLIYHCFDYPELKDEFNTIFVDILQTTSLQEFTFLLGKAVFDSLTQGPKKWLSKFVETLKSLSGKFSFDTVTGAPSFTIQLGDIVNPTYTLEEIFEFMERSPRPCIVAIDEFQQITTYPEKNVEALLRTHIQRYCNCKFIFAGSSHHIISEMFTYPNRPFYHSASQLPLGPIKMEVYTEFVIRQFERFGKTVGKEAVEHVYRQFGGVTYYMQAVFNEAFYQTPQQGHCDESGIETAIDTILEAGSYVNREVLSALSIRQKELLVAIAKEGSVKGITSADFIKRHGLVSASSVQNALKKLEGANIVVRNEGEYSVANRFLALWLQKTY